MEVDEAITSLNEKLIMAMDKLSTKEASSCCIVSCEKSGGGKKTTIKKRKYRIQKGGAGCADLTNLQRYTLYVALSIGTLGLVYFSSGYVVGGLISIFKEVMIFAGIIEGTALYEFMLLIANIGSILVTYIKNVFPTEAISNIICAIANTLFNIIKNPLTFLASLTPGTGRVLLSAAQELREFDISRLTLERLSESINGALTTLVGKFKNAKECVVGAVCRTYLFLNSKVRRTFSKGREASQRASAAFSHAFSPIAPITDPVGNFIHKFLKGLLERICGIVVKISKLDFDLEQLPGSKRQKRQHLIQALVNPITLSSVEASAAESSPVEQLLNVDIQSPDIIKELLQAVKTPEMVISRAVAQSQEEDVRMPAAEEEANDKKRRLSSSQNRIQESINNGNKAPKITGSQSMEIGKEGAAPQGGRKRKRKTRTKKRRGSYGKHLKRRSYKRVRKY